MGTGPNLHLRKLNPRFFSEDVVRDGLCFWDHKLQARIISLEHQDHPSFY